MSECALKQRIVEDMKTAMRAKEVERLGVIRLILSAMKQKEVDERVVLTDADILAILDKMVKQRRDSITQFEQAGRHELADKEKSEVELIQSYLPQQLSDAEITQLIKAAITETGAKTVKEMGAVMNLLRPQLQGRADMGNVSKKIKELLV
jgi:uncharacterized protein YqeY